MINHKTKWHDNKIVWIWRPHPQIIYDDNSSKINKNLKAIFNKTASNASLHYTVSQKSDMFEVWWDF